MSRVEERYTALVRESAIKLGADRPDWAGLVDRKRLDMAHARNCLLGQVYGHYGRGVRALGIPWWPVFREARAFNPPFWRRALVRWLWLAEIDARLAREREPIVLSEEPMVDGQHRLDL